MTIDGMKHICRYTQVFMTMWYSQSVKHVVQKFQYLKEMITTAMESPSC